jgi:hypothetical protein
MAPEAAGGRMHGEMSDNHAPGLFRTVSANNKVGSDKSFKTAFPGAIGAFWLCAASSGSPWFKPFRRDPSPNHQ